MSTKTQKWPQSIIHKNREEMTQMERNKLEEKISHYEDRFEDEMDKEYPRHPHRVMMEIRKENGLYGSGMYKEPMLLKALEVLKDRYKNQWQEMKNGQN